ncbi:MAG: hypothetical protein C4562_07355 [Actinobacteria bacterium]|nr:MAG: hypothetical protein C4562_07355 [Actinomycetota bacterium]
MRGGTPNNAKLKVQKSKPQLKIKNYNQLNGFNKLLSFELWFLAFIFKFLVSMGRTPSYSKCAIIPLSYDI